MNRKPFTLDRAEVVDSNFIRFVGSWRPEPASRASLGSHSPRRLDERIVPDATLTCADVIELFESQMIARHQDIESRNMRARNEGFYTIGSSGHEGNAVVGRVTRHTDPAFLHYRSGALLAERARKVPGVDVVRDTMLSFAASALDPISGGRHKVWGSVPLCVPPQTSTIASHLPKSVGTAFFLKRARRLLARAAAVSVSDSNTPSLQPPFIHPFSVVPDDAIVVCSFGDASINHATAQTAFNAACWTAHQGLPMPILFICEDNGIGISVPSPPGWVEASMRARPGLAYFQADGLNIVETHRVVSEAVSYCRERRAPVALHLKVVRLLGHAGTDAEHGYRTWEQIEQAEAQDPLLHTARLVLGERVMTAKQVLGLYEAVRARVREAAEYAATTPKLTTAEEVVRPLAPYHPDAVRAEAELVPDTSVQAQVSRPEDQPVDRSTPRHMAALINLGLHDILSKYPKAVLFGEDVGKKGGVYAITAGVQAKFGVGRVFDTLLDETMVLGMAIGAGHLGLLPIPEIQYLAYYHNAQDQIRGEACSLQYFSNGQYRNPMVIRVQGWSYQKGFGGHFHNDNSIAAMRDVPGLIVATPSRGDDAVKMMRTLVALAKVDGRLCIIVEPIALYMVRDLYEPKDGGWQFPYPAPGEAISLGEGAVYHEEARDVTIITFANGLYMSLRAAKTLEEKHGVCARVVDLRWLSPLNEEFIAEQAASTGRVLVVDEGRRSGGVGEAVLAVIHERCNGHVVAKRMTAVDTYVPLGPAADGVLPLEADIMAAARALVSEVRS